MRDKAHNGSVDPTRDHHMINGRLVPVTERPATRAQKSRSTKRNKGEKSGAGASATSKPNA